MKLKLDWQILKDDEIENCIICGNPDKELYTFTCNHKICSICLFRYIFLNNIKDFNYTKNDIEIKCKCQKGTLTKNYDEISKINVQKNKIFYDNFKNSKNSFINDKFCQFHKKSNLAYYCVDCTQELCSECIPKDVNKNSHINHNIFKFDYLIHLLRKDVLNMKLNFNTKNEFEQKWNEICSKIKNEAQQNFNEIMTKIDEVLQSIINFRNFYEENYKSDLTKIVKILKLYKVFYFDFYFQKKSAEDTNNINLLRYVKSIKNELTDVEIEKNAELFNKLDSIKNIFESLNKIGINFSLNFNFKELPQNYHIEQVIEKAHENFVNGIFSIDEQRILTGSLDFSMKVWDEKNYKFENIKKFKGGGSICCMSQLKNGNLLTSAANNNNINIWAKKDNNNYEIIQSLSVHEKPVLSFAELDDGRLVSGGWDNLIIIWEKDESDSYIEKQRIKDKLPILKIISLTNNKFAFSCDNRIRIMREKKYLELKLEDNFRSSKNEIIDGTNEDKDNEPNNEINENSKNDENKFIVCYKLSKHTGRIKAMLQLKNGYLVSGGGDAGKKKDNSIIIWRPNELDGFYYTQILEGHEADINNIIELKDGRICSSSKDKTIRIWKSFMIEDKNHQKVLQFQIDEILSEYEQGIFQIIQLNDGRIVSSGADFAIVVWKDRKFLPFC